jgi:RNA polymerase sigma-70 factor (ECF subfamily)
MALLTTERPARPHRAAGGARDDGSRDADASLMAAFLRREPAAAAALYAKYASRIYGFGLVLLKDRADAEDLVQDTFLKAWRRGSMFDPLRGSLDTWILLMARNLAIDLLRRRKLEAKVRLSEARAGSEVSQEPSPELYAERRDLVERAREAIGRLPAPQRSALELAYLGDRSSTQVAELERIPLGTAKSRIRQGIATLHQVFSNNDPLPMVGRETRT